MPHVFIIYVLCKQEYVCFTTRRDPQRKNKQSMLLHVDDIATIEERLLHARLLNPNFVCQRTKHQYLMNKTSLSYRKDNVRKSIIRWICKATDNYNTQYTKLRVVDWQKNMVKKCVENMGRKHTTPHQDIKYILLTAQFFGLLPVEGVTSSDVSQLKFRWCTIRVSYAVFLTVPTFILTALAFYRVSQEETDAVSKFCKLQTTL